MVNHSFAPEKSWRSRHWSLATFAEVAFNSPIPVHYPERLAT
jgi:hypothetical protein